MSWRSGRRGSAATALVAAATAAGGILFGAGGASAAATAATAFAWGPAHDIPISSAVGSYADVTAMSCPAPGDCLAAGSYYNGALPGFVVEQENGTWGTVQPIPGLSPLSGGSGVTVDSASCASPGNCAVAGSVYAPYPTSGSKLVLRGFVVSEVKGTWQTADILPPPVAAAKLLAGKMTSVSCSAPGYCVAGGYDASDYPATMAVVVEETNGTWGAPSLVPGAPVYDMVNSVSCTAPGDCVAGLGAGLFEYRGAAAALATENGGTWSVQAVPGVSALAGQQRSSGIDSVSCPAAGECTAAGEADTLSNGNLAFVVGEQGGTWGQASLLPNGPPYATSAPIVPGRLPLSCAAPGDCALASGGAIANEVNGTWTSQVAYPSLPGITPPAVAGGTDAMVTAVSCPSPGNCSAGGFISPTDTKMYAFVIDEVNGTWGKAVRVAGTNYEADVLALSCAAAGGCVAAGTTGTTSGQVGYYTEQVPVAATTTKVTLSARSVPYGREHAEKVTVTVTAASGTPTGSATVWSGHAKVCTVRLSRGHGSCRPGATRFRAGRVVLRARYAGPAWYARSTSPGVSFRVTRAGTGTRLRLSRGEVRYGHERAERIVVRVIPRYAGTAAGKVIVRERHVTICVIRLRQGAGSCRMAVRRLRPGTYHLVARYRGNADFAPSASRAAKLRVTLRPLPWYPVSHARHRASGRTAARFAPGGRGIARTHHGRSPRGRSARAAP